MEKNNNNFYAKRMTNWDIFLSTMILYSYDCNKFFEEKMLVSLHYIVLVN